MNLLQIQDKNGVQVVGSPIIADELGIEHKNLLATVRSYKDTIEESFSRVAFEKAPLQTRGGIQYCTVAYLTEDQAIFVATLSRNTERVVAFKAKLVQSFQAARKMIEQVTSPMSKAEMTLQVINFLQEEAQSLKHQNLLLEQSIQKQAPVLEYANKVLLSAGSHPITVIAQDHSMSAVNLNRKLKEFGVIRKVDGVWCLTSKFQGHGYTEMRTHPYLCSDGSQKVSMQMVWTQKGRAFIHSLLNRQVGN